MATHQFRFKSDEDYADARLTLHLASLAVEGQYGEARVRLEAKTQIDRGARTVQVDDSGPIGEGLIRAFTKLLLEEFGPTGFEVATGEAIRDEAPSSRAFVQPSDQGRDDGNTKSND